MAQENLITSFQSWSFSLLIILIVVFFLFILGYILLIWWRNHDREKKSLEYVLLQVAVPFGKSIAEGLKITAGKCASACPTGALSLKENGLR